MTEKWLTGNGQENQKDKQMTIGTLPNDDEIDLALVTAAQAVLDLDELRDLGMIESDLDADLEGLRYVVCRGAQLGMLPTRRAVAICAVEYVRTTVADDESIEATKVLVERIEQIGRL